MLHITLGADDLVAVAYERYHHPEPIVQRKMTVLWLKQQGLPHHEIARLAGFPGLPLPAISKSSPKAAWMLSAASPGKDAVVNSTTTGSVDDELEPVLREARAASATSYFVDASHFVFGSFLGYVWCFVRLCIRAASGRKRYNVLGAVHAVSHRLIRVANHSYINASSVCDLLRAVAQASVGRPITLVLDNARYQKCAPGPGLARSLKIHLLFLPSYSPNLNLIERVWKFVKKECCSRCSTRVTRGIHGGDWTTVWLN